MLERGKFSEENGKLTSSTRLPLPGGTLIPASAHRMRTDTLRGDAGLSSKVSGMRFTTVWGKAEMGTTNPQLGMMVQWAPSVMGTPAPRRHMPGWWSLRPSAAFVTRENLSQQLQGDLEKILPLLVLHILEDVLGDPPSPWPPQRRVSSHHLRMRKKPPPCNCCFQWHPLASKQAEPAHSEAMCQTTLPPHQGRFWQEKGSKFTFSPCSGPPTPPTVTRAVIFHVPACFSWTPKTLGGSSALPAGKHHTPHR